jgi:4-amino-4-deoxy-L-arabinose transferase-like glycosyltransferase
MNPGRGRGWGTVCIATLAVALFLVTFLPWSTWLGFTAAEEVLGYSHTFRAWLLWTVAILAVALALDFAWRDGLERHLVRWREKLLGLPGHGYALACAAALLAAAALLSSVLFARNPHNVDSIAQLFQARIFLGGSLTAPAPEYPEFFGATHLLIQEGRWFSQYPPGHPVLLGLGLLAGLPWLVNPLFAAATLVLVFAAARRLLGEGGARLAAALYLVSPFALFMSASYMNHVTSGFFLALALYTAVRTEGDARGRVWLLATGAALALAATIRPLEAAAWAAVLGVWILLRRGWRSAAVVGAACLVGLAPLLLYNSLTTGHPLRFGYSLLWGAGHGLGFHTDPWGEPFTPIVSFANTALDFQRLNVLLYLWPFPSLIFVFVALVYAVRADRSRGAIALLGALLFAAPLAYFFYWHRDNYLGPRFVFASLVPAVILTAAGILALDRRLGRWRGALWLALLSGALVGLTVYFPQSAGLFAGRMLERKLHPEIEAERAGIGDALVFVKVGWGSRLIPRLWAWGIPASQALTSQLQTWRDMNLAVVRDVLPDQSVRVDTSAALPERCYREVQQDEAGFTVYGTLIWRNDPWLTKGTVYARDFGPERNRRLQALYPGRRSYLYAPLNPEPGAQPVLSPLARLGSRVGTSEGE